MYVSVANFYLQGVLYPIWCFRNTTGLFKETKHTMIIAAILNIILSIVLGIKWGMFGIFFATVISRLCTNIWYDPYRLFKSYFNASVIPYFIGEILRLIFIVSFIVASECLFINITFGVGWTRLIIKAVYCTLTVNGIFYIRYRNTHAFHFIMGKAVEMGKRVYSKNSKR